MQGWAKIKLEQIALDAMKRGTHIAVYNCPEILTNSSSIFQGVEVSLYPLLAALQKEGAHSKSVQALVEQCQSLLKPEHSLAEVQASSPMKYLTLENYDFLQSY